MGGSQHKEGARAPGRREAVQQQTPAPGRHAVQLKAALGGASSFAEQEAMLSPGAAGAPGRGVQMHGGVDQKPDAQAGLKDRIHRSTGSLQDEIEQLADECTITDDELMAVLAKLAKLGGQGSGALVSVLSDKAKEELIDNLNPPHLAYRAQVLEIYHVASPSLLNEWIDMDVLTGMPVGGLGGREAALLMRIVGRLAPDKKQELLESANGPAVKKAMEAGNAYGKKEAEAEATAALNAEMLPKIKVELAKSPQGKDALAILDTVQVFWRAGASAAIIPGAPGEVKGMIIGSSQGAALAAQYLIHECFHVTQRRGGKSGDAGTSERAAYVDLMVTEETDATILSAESTMHKGGGTQIPGEDLYIAYHKKTIRDGGDEAKAREVGRSKLKLAFMTGGGDSYPVINYGKYYGDEWDAVNAEKAGGKGDADHAGH